MPRTIADYQVIHERLSFLLRRRLALAFAAVPHSFFNFRCGRGGRGIDFEQRILCPLKDLPFKSVRTLDSRSGRSGQSRSSATFLHVIGIKDNIRRKFFPQSQILRPEVQDGIEEFLDWFPERAGKVRVRIAVLVDDRGRRQKFLEA